MDEVFPSLALSVLGRHPGADNWVGELGTLLERQWRVQIVLAVSFSLLMKKVRIKSATRLVPHYARS